MDGLYFGVMILADIVTRTTGEPLAEWIRSKVGGSPKERLVVEIAFNDEGIPNWFRAEGEADDVLDALRVAAAGPNLNLVPVTTARTPIGRPFLDVIR